MKKIALIYMGGTFGCIGEPLQPLAADLFIPKLRDILPIQLEIDCLVAPSIKDSSACEARDWLQLAQQIQSLKNEYQYFVVIHGTDTLSYAAAVLSHVIGQQAHVVLTGSQYPLLNSQGNDIRQFSDALENLHHALNAVLNCPKGVFVSFHAKLLHGRTVLKQHTTELDAFVGQQQLDALHQPDGFEVTDTMLAQSNHFNCMSLMLQPLGLLQRHNQLRTLSSQPPDFLILQGFGVGNFSADTAIVQQLQQLFEQGCVSIMTTQVPFGGIRQDYAVSDWMQQARLIQSDSYGHADLYAKALKMYLQYPSADLRWAHWHDAT